MNKKNIGKRYRYVGSAEDFNKIVSIAGPITTILHAQDYKIDYNTNTRNYSFFEEKQRYVYFTTRYVKDVEKEDGTVEYVYSKEKYVCTWIFDKTGETACQINPSTVYRMSQNVYKPLDMEPKSKDSIFDVFGDKVRQSASPIIGFNKEYDNTEHYVYVYDLNSAYAEVLTNKIIDTYHCRRNSIVGEDEVGFMLDQKLTMVSSGNQADYVFKLMESPYKDFVEYWYNIKKTAPKGSKERIMAKQILVIMVGLWQNHNPFLRAFVVNSCNEKIQKIIDANKDIVCMWNTDAVYSTEPIEGLDIGDDIGQFKLEYQGLFRQKGLNYQKVDANETAYRGVCKCSIKKDFNILKDKVEKSEMPYGVSNRCRIIKNFEGEQIYD